MRENDLEILETWLDGELPDEQVEQLRRRIADEPELAQAIDQLRGERQLRSQCWQTFESSNADVETLIASVRRNVQREEMWNFRLGTLRRFSGIAASITVVFMAGWLAHSRLHVASPDAFSSSPESPAAQPIASNIPSTNNQIQFQQPGNINFVGAPIAPRMPGIRPANYQLQIRDRQGHVWVQPLDKLDDPNKFMADVNRFESQQQQPRQSSDPVLVDHQQP
jgi:hypothetical protein